MKTIGPIFSQYLQPALNQPKSHISFHKNKLPALQLLYNDFVHNLSHAIESVFIGKTNHRFTGGAGTKLATSEVEQWHCGTTGSGYLKDGTSALPSSPGDEVEATVCFNNPFSSPCMNLTTIKIKRCRNFWIYYLPSTPGCPYKYCGQQ